MKKTFYLLAIKCIQVAIPGSAFSQLTFTINQDCGATATAVVTGTPGGAVSYSWTVLQQGTCTATYTNLAVDGSAVALGNLCCGNAVVTCTAYATGTATVAVTQSVFAKYCPPTVNIIASKTLACDGHSLGLAASGANSYTWHGVGNTASVAVTPTGPTVYTVTGLSGSTGCTASKTIFVSMFTPTFQVTPASPVLLCSGSMPAQITLSASGAHSYTWSSPPSQFHYITITPTENTTVVVSATSMSNNIHCVSTKTITFISGTPPSIFMQLNPKFPCEGDVLQVTASGAVTYTWSNGATGSQTSFTPATGMNVYTLSAHSASGCKADINFSVMPLPWKQFVVSPLTATVCAGSALVISATGAGGYLLNGAPASPPFTVVPEATGDYTVTGDDGSFCYEPSIVQVQADPCTGVAVNFSGSLMIFPNPVTDILNISGTGEADVWISNVLGEKSFLCRIYGDSTPVDLSRFEAGIYLLMISDGTTSFFSRVVKE